MMLKQFDIHMQKINQDTDLNTIHTHTHTHTHTKWITDLNIKCKTMKLLEDNISNLGFAGDFLGKMLKAKSIRNGTWWKWNTSLWKTVSKNEKMHYSLGENICKRHFCKGLSAKIPKKKKGTS